MKGAPVLISQEDRDRAKQLVVWADQEGWTALQFLLACALILDTSYQEYGVSLQEPDLEELEALNENLH